MTESSSWRFFIQQVIDVRSLKMVCHRLFFLMRATILGAIVPRIEGSVPQEISILTL